MDNSKRIIIVALVIIAIVLFANNISKNITGAAVDKSCELNYDCSFNVGQSKTIDNYKVILRQVGYSGAIEIEIGQYIAVLRADEKRSIGNIKDIEIWNKRGKIADPLRNSIITLVFTKKGTQEEPVLIPTNGQCASITLATSLNENSLGLCSEGSLDKNSFSTSTNGWSWICAGKNRGISSDICTATLVICSEDKCYNLKGNTEIDSGDLVLLGNCKNKKLTDIDTNSGITCSQADFNDDGEIGDADATCLNIHWNEKATCNLPEIKIVECKEESSCNLKIGETTTINWRSVKLIRVNEYGNTFIEVNGIETTAITRQTRTINGLNILLVEKANYNKANPILSDATFVISKEVKASIQTQQTKCSDSDNGKHYYVAGQACLGRECSLDDCHSDGSLTEAYCDNGIRTERYTCPNGCNNGACIRCEENKLRLIENDFAAEKCINGVWTRINI